MTGFGRFGLFDDELAARRRHVEDVAALDNPQQFECTVDGCSAARRYLENKGYVINPGLTGWEIVAMANEVLEGE